MNKKYSLLAALILSSISCVAQFSADRIYIGGYMNSDILFQQYLSNNKAELSTMEFEIVPKLGFVLDTNKVLELGIGYGYLNSPNGGSYSYPFLTNSNVIIHYIHSSLQYIHYKKIVNKVYFANKFGIEYSVGLAKIDIDKIYTDLSVGYAPAFLLALSEKFKLNFSFGGIYYSRIVEIPDVENKKYKYVDHKADLRFNASDFQLDVIYILK